MVAAGATIGRAQTPGAPPAGQAAPPASAAERAARAMIDADRRVATVGYRINAANLDRCPVSGFDPGLVLEAADQFPRATRAAAQRAFGLGDRVTVSAVVPNSPADRAQVRPGDELMAVDGRAIGPAPLGRAEASYASTEAALDAIDSAAAGRDTLDLKVRRGGRVTTLTTSTPPGCAIRVQLAPGRDINGFADDRYASITAGLEAFARDDDELALFLGHELAHAYLQHEARLNRAAPLHGLLGRALVSPRTVLETEREADRLGMILAAKAGFDVSRAPEFWRRLGAVSADGGFARTHPGTSERIAAAEQEVAEIHRKQAEHLPL